MKIGRPRIHENNAACVRASKLRTRSRVLDSSFYTNILRLMYVKQNINPDLQMVLPWIFLHELRENIQRTATIEELVDALSQMPWIEVKDLDLRNPRIRIGTKEKYGPKTI